MGHDTRMRRWGSNSHSHQNSFTQRHRRARSWPVLEAMEPRCLLATFTVTSLADAGPGLAARRDRAGQHGRGPGHDRLRPGRHRDDRVDAALPDLATDIVLSGPGASALTVARSQAEGTPSFRIFTVPAGAEVAISGLTITHGRAAGTSSSNVSPSRPPR